MKKFSVILCLICVGSLIWKDIAAFSWNIWFYNNQVVLAEKYCENKDKPKLQCNGKCYLAKKLQLLEQEEKQNQPVPKMPLKLVEVAIISPISTPAFSLPVLLSENVKTNSFLYVTGKTNPFHSDIFHPPIYA